VLQEATSYDDISKVK